MSNLDPAAAEASAAAAVPPSGGDQTQPVMPGTAATGDLAAQSAAPAWKAPDFIPAHLQADKPEELVTNLAEDWKRQRDDIAQRGAPPASPAEYAYTPSDKVKSLVGDLVADPVMNLFKEQAHKAGLPAAAFQTIVGGLYDQMAEKGLLPPPYSEENEFKAMLGDAAAGLSKDQMAQIAAPRIKAAETFLDGLVNNTTLDEPAVNELKAMLDLGHGVRAIEGLMRAMGQVKPGIQPSGDAAPVTGMTAKDLTARNADPRNDPDNPKFDRAFADETHALYKKFYG